MRFKLNFLHLEFCLNKSNIAFLEIEFRQYGVFGYKGKTKLRYELFLFNILIILNINIHFNFCSPKANFIPPCLHSSTCLNFKAMKVLTKEVTIN